MKTYQTSHSEIASGTAEAVWAIWADIGNWPSWDEGLANCVHDGSFAAGETFLLTPKGIPEAIQVRLTDVVPGRRFVDETVLPFGRLTASHEVQEVPGGVRVTHKIEAAIDPEHTAMFEQNIWAGMEQGVAQSVRNLVSLAESNS